MLKTMIEPEKNIQQSPSVILRARDVKKHFPIKGGILGRVQGYVKAVDGVNLDIYQGETLGIVGESGCGKSTVGRVLLNLIEASSGTVEFEEQDIFKLSGEKMRNLRKDMQLIFQDPYSSLNPRLSVGDIIGRVLKIHGMKDFSAREKRVQELLELVGLSPYHIRRYPMSSVVDNAKGLE
jgi:oligopeptide transport system ATP-binding protein